MPSDYDNDLCKNQVVTTVLRCNLKYWGRKNIYEKHVKVSLQMFQINVYENEKILTIKSPNQNCLGKSVSKG